MVPIAWSDPDNRGYWGVCTDYVDMRGVGESIQLRIMISVTGATGTWRSGA